MHQAKMGLTAFYCKVLLPAQNNLLLYLHCRNFCKIKALENVCVRERERHNTHTHRQAGVAMKFSL
jgi:hypothetical protein